jgi:SPP1 family predicted phage head-tail adaptor
VQIHFATTTVNDYGERIQAWGALGTYFAQVQYLDLRSKEAEAAGQETVMASVQFTIRRNSQVTENMRVYFNGRLFDIESISHDESKQYNTLTCKQYSAFGVVEPESEFAVGNLAYTQTFTELTGDEIVVTVYGGNLPANAAQIFVFYNGQFINDWTHTGDTITLTYIEMIETDVITITFFA